MALAVLSVIFKVKILILGAMSMTEKIQVKCEKRQGFGFYNFIGRVWKPNTDSTSSLWDLTDSTQ